MSGSDHDNEAFPMAADERPHQDSADIASSHMLLLVNLLLTQQTIVYEGDVTDDDERGGGFGPIAYEDDVAADDERGGGFGAIAYEEEVTDDDERGGGFGAVPASDKAIDELEEAAVGNTREAECVVCLETFKEGDDISKLPCSHGFHKSCISDWLRVSCLCPQCRFALPADDDVGFETSKKPFQICATS
ncbi:hypothetical protein ZWY2020_052339 [Hordeum vulgare]|nr:hypothetical protein ZWY2020_052339 [Hordeum vulgare]